MSEYIEREAAIQSLPQGLIYQALVELAAEAINSVPAADVRAVVRGFNKRHDYPGLFTCSVCGWEDDDTYTGDSANYNYCPHCGAVMEDGLSLTRVYSGDRLEEIFCDGPSRTPAPTEDPRPCPFCGIRLVYREDSVDAAHARIMNYYLHEKTGCILDGLEVRPEDLPAWNERAVEFKATPVYPIGE